MEPSKACKRIERTCAAMKKQEKKRHISKFCYELRNHPKSKLEERVRKRNRKTAIKEHERKHGIEQECKLGNCKIICNKASRTFKER